VNRSRRAFLCLAVLSGALLTALPCQTLPAQEVSLPLKQGSLRFAVIGDNGTGEKAEYEVGQQMELFRQKTGFDFVIMLGDNIYGGEGTGAMKKKFEDPYKPLLDAGVKFYASLGNHDNPNERFYKPFNMNEKRYYSFRKGKVEFLALDSNYMDPQQLDWLSKELQGSDSPWKLCFFHHPLYSDGKFHGPDLDLRSRLEPVFDAGGVNVVLSGHEHLYERVVPKNGVSYFVLGNSGELRLHGLKQTPDVAKGFDTDRSFMVVEIAGDQFFFQAVSRTGQTIDSGVIDRQPAPKAAGSH
jgi:3',5'-cyclic AMP phosphodiesterase CpdA